MSAFTKAFGPGATSGAIEGLAREISSLSGDHPSLVAQILRYTLIPWTEAQAASKACTASPLSVTAADHQAWLSRFGAESDEVAYASAKALFSITPASGEVRLLPWYHGLTSPSAGAAQASLSGKPPGSFLLRVSGSVAGSFAFSYVVASGEIRHTRVHRSPGGYLCDGRTTLASSLPDLVKDLSAALTTPCPSTLSAVSLVTIPEAFTGGSALSVGAAAAEDSPYASYGEIAASPSVPVPVTTPAASVATPLASPSSAPSSSPSGVGVGGGSGDGGGFDVMISYSWANQPLVLRLKQALESQLGLKVWMDLSHMSSTYLSDMVTAVNTARSVILCVSDKYLASQNCLSEVNLVSEWRSTKPYVICVLEEHIYPGRVNHPIAILAAGRLFCSLAKANADPSDQAAFDAGFADIKRQLGEKGILKTAAPLPAPYPGSPPALSPSSSTGSTAAGAGAGAASGSSPQHAAPLTAKTPSVSTPMDAPAADADSVAAALAGVSVS